MASTVTVSAARPSSFTLTRCAFSGVPARAGVEGRFCTGQVLKSGLDGEAVAEGSCTCCKAGCPLLPLPMLHCARHTVAMLRGKWHVLHPRPRV